MSVVIPTGFLEAQIGITSSDNSHVSSISFAFAGDATGEVAFNALAVFQAALPDIAQDMPSEYSMVDARFTAPAPGGGTGSLTFPFDEPIVGANPGDLMDPRIACVYNKRTGLLGRHGRGRFYLPGVVDEEVDSNGRINPDRTEERNNHAETFLEKLLDPAGGLDGLVLVLLHAEVGMEPSDIVGIDITPLIARIRRRLS
jgi:hypothetical protein